MSVPHDFLFLLRSAVPPGINGPGMCVALSAFTCQHVRTFGVRPIFQAGSAGWVNGPSCPDDEKSWPCFGHRFNAVSDSTVKLVQSGRLPEMHCWTVVPKWKALIDLSAGHIPELYRLMSGQDWPADAAIPKSVIELAEPDRFAECYYDADPVAIVVANAVGRKEGSRLLDHKLYSNVGKVVCKEFRGWFGDMSAILDQYTGKPSCPFVRAASVLGSEKMEATRVK